MYLARVLGQVGHKVIVVETNIAEGFVLTRFSRFVYKFVNLADSRSDSEYIDDLLKIWEEEKIDWFVPLGTNAVGDIEAKMRMENSAAIFGREFSSLCLCKHSEAEGRVNLLKS